MLWGWGGESVLGDSWRGWCRGGEEEKRRGGEAVKAEMCLSRAGVAFVINMVNNNSVGLRRAS